MTSDPVIGHVWEQDESWRSALLSYRDDELAYSWCSALHPDMGSALTEFRASNGMRETAVLDENDAMIAEYNAQLWLDRTALGKYGKITVLWDESDGYTVTNDHDDIDVSLLDLDRDALVQYNYRARNSIASAVALDEDGRQCAALLLERPYGPTDDWCRARFTKRPLEIGGFIVNKECRNRHLGIRLIQCVASTLAGLVEASEETPTSVIAVIHRDNTASLGAAVPWASDVSHASAHLYGAEVEVLHAVLDDGLLVPTPVPRPILSPDDITVFGTHETPMEGSIAHG